MTEVERLVASMAATIISGKFSDGREITKNNIVESVEIALQICETILNIESPKRPHA